MSALFGGVRLQASEFVPEFAHYVVEDAADRMRAMTLHHIDLSLLDLTVSERTVFGLGGDLLICHPNNVTMIREALASALPKGEKP